jgi:phospholipid/cholesterol/gamma-HCH transport system substrate-binding protein
MRRGSLETAVGVFVLIGLGCVGYLAVQLGELGVFQKKAYYSVLAQFDSVSGLKKGASVEMAGVEIGKVEDIALETRRLTAMVKLRIRKDVPLDEDVIASVKTSGLIGDKYIKLSPGGSETLLKSGDIITETDSALDIEELVSKYVFGKM